MFNSELGSLVKKEQYKDFEREVSHYGMPRRRSGVTFLLLLGLCVGLVLVAWSCNMVMGMVSVLNLPV